MSLHDVISAFKPLYIPHYRQQKNTVKLDLIISQFNTHVYAY